MVCLRVSNTFTDVRGLAACTAMIAVRAMIVVSTFFIKLLVVNNFWVQIYTYLLKLQNIIEDNSSFNPLFRHYDLATTDDINARFQVVALHATPLQVVDMTVIQSSLFTVDCLYS